MYSIRCHSTPDTMFFLFERLLLNLFMLNENQTRKLVAGCSNSVLRLQMETDVVLRDFRRVLLNLLDIWLRINFYNHPYSYFMKFCRISGRAAAQPFIKVEPICSLTMAIVAKIRPNHWLFPLNPMKIPASHGWPS